MPAFTSVREATASYRICTYPPVIAYYREAPVAVIHDVPSHTSWERFDEGALPKYMKDGVRSFHMHLDRLADLTTPHTTEDDKQLWFMLESLIQARHLADETVQDRTP